MKERCEGAEGIGRGGPAVLGASAEHLCQQVLWAEEGQAELVHLCQMQSQQPRHEWPSCARNLGAQKAAPWVSEQCRDPGKDSLPQGGEGPVASACSQDCGCRRCCGVRPGLCEVRQPLWSRMMLEDLARTAPGTRAKSTCLKHPPLPHCIGWGLNGTGDGKNLGDLDIHKHGQKCTVTKVSWSAGGAWAGMDREQTMQGAAGHQKGSTWVLG